MDVLSNLVVAAIAVVFATGVLVWWLRRRAAFRSGLARRGWLWSQDGASTTVAPARGDWAVTMSRSFAAQMSPPSSHVVVSTWTSAVPRAAAGTLVIGPAPPPQLRGLAAEPVGSATPTMAHRLGIDRVTGGRPLSAVAQVDDRLLVFATGDYGPIGSLTAVADAISDWCASYRGEREQPVVTVDESGVRVRVRTDVLRRVEQLDEFVALGTRCRDALGGSAG